MTYMVTFSDETVRAVTILLAFCFAPLAWYLVTAGLVFLRDLIVGE